MSEKKVIFVGFWKEALEDIIKFLEVKEFEDKSMIDHMKTLVEEREKK